MNDDKVAMPDIEPGDNQSQTVDGKLDVPADADKAAGFLLQGGEDYGELTPEAEKRLKRKIDWFMVPMVCLLQYLCLGLTLTEYSYFLWQLLERSTRSHWGLRHCMAFQRTITSSASSTVGWDLSCRLEPSLACHSHHI